MIDESLMLERVNILLNAEMIGEIEYSTCQNAINILKLFDKKFDDEKAGIFIVHLAIAANRILKNEYESEMNDSIIESLKDDINYKTSIRILDEIISKSEIKFPKSEINLLTIHICNLLQE